MRSAAIEAALAAGDVLLYHFTRKLKISEKPGAGLVTNADLEAERRAVKILKKKFPSFTFLTEESTVEPTHGITTAGRWIIDPLDGTTNYVHRFPMFCVSIAAEWEGKIAVGVIYHPILKNLYVAVQGKGATLNGKSMHVSQTSKMDSALLTTGFTYLKEELLRAEMKTFEKLSGMSRAIRRPGSAALDLAYTAQGVFDGFWEHRLSPWDIAAGALLVSEAGGRVSDFLGNPFNVHSPEIVASNSVLHRALLNAVAGKK
jgi:myo-inositol-1(or 4)-monophosphatase